MISLPKALEVLICLNSYERTKFRKFITSPYFNHREDVTQLYALVDDIDLVKAEKYKPEDIFKKLFPKDVWDEKKLNYLFSYLLKSMEAFFILEELENEEDIKKIYLLRAYRKRNLRKHFEYHYLDKKKVDKNNLFHTESFFVEYQFLHEEYELNSNTDREGAASNLHKMNESLNNHFILNRLKQACKALLVKNISNSEYQIDFLDDILKILNQQKLVSPLIDIYYHMYMLYVSNEYAYYEAIQSMVSTHKKRIHTKELRDIHSLMINYIIKKVNTGNHELVNVLLDLYKSALEDEVLIENNSLSHFTYRNITAAALLAKDYTWCREFIEKYKKNIQENYREDYYQFNLSKYYFATRDYKQSAFFMNKVDMEDVLTNLNAKSTLIKAYIELKDYVFADYQIDRLKQYLWRKKLSSYHKTNYQNFIKYAKIILDLDHKKVKNLRKEIENQKILTDREWLLEKLKNYE